MSDERQKNREAFPQTAALVDKFRKYFGPGVKLTYARENGREIGKPDAWVQGVCA